VTGRAGRPRAPAPPPSSRGAKQPGRGDDGGGRVLPHGGTGPGSRGGGPGPGPCPHRKAPDHARSCWISSVTRVLAVVMPPVHRAAGQTSRAPGPAGGVGNVAAQLAAAPGGDPAPEERLRDIEAIADAALSRLEAPALLRELLERIRSILGTDTAAVLLLDGGSGELVATAASGIEEQMGRGPLVRRVRAALRRAEPGDRRRRGLGPAGGGDHGTDALRAARLRAGGSRPRRRAAQAGQRRSSTSRPRPWPPCCTRSARPPAASCGFPRPATCPRCSPLPGSAPGRAGGEGQEGHGADGACGAVMDALTGAGAPADDIALLILRREAPAPAAPPAARL
jgi:hypothetical protein